MKEKQLKELIEYRDGLNKEIVSNNRFLRRNKLKPQRCYKEVLNNFFCNFLNSIRYIHEARQ